MKRDFFVLFPVTGISHIFSINSRTNHIVMSVEGNFETRSKLLLNASWKRM